MILLYSCFKRKSEESFSSRTLSESKLREQTKISKTIGLISNTKLKSKGKDILLLERSLKQ